MNGLINYLKPGETPHVPTILQRMSEWGRCLITGITEDLQPFPVDFNPQNILASNLSCLSRELVKRFSLPISYSVTISDYKVRFCSPYELKEYNQMVVSLINLDGLADQRPDRALLEIYERLTRHHAKGMDLISDSQENFLFSDQIWAYYLKKLQGAPTKPLTIV